MSIKFFVVSLFAYKSKIFALAFGIVFIYAKFCKKTAYRQKFAKKQPTGKILQKKQPVGKILQKKQPTGHILQKHKLKAKL